MNFLKKEQGFNLIELMVVIGVLTILITIGIPRFLDAKRANNTAQIAADLRSIDSAIAMYEIANGTSPKKGELQKSGLYPSEANASKYFDRLPAPPTGDIYYATVPGGAAKSLDDFNTSTPKKSYMVEPPTAQDVPTGKSKIRGTLDIGGVFYTFEYFSHFQR